MAKEKLTPKQEEIQLLERLRTLKGSFAEKFDQDIPCMQQNIRMDHPIELNCRFMSLEESLTAAVKEKQSTIIDKMEMIDALNEAIVKKIEYIEEQDTRLNNILEYLVNADYQCEQARAYGYFPIQQIIEKKFQMKIALNSNEQDYILSKINS